MPFDAVNIVAVGNGDTQIVYYDDSVGAVAATGVNTPYHVAQLDGTLHLRGSSAGDAIIPQIGTSNAWWVKKIYTTEANQRTFILNPASLQSGGIAAGAAYAPELVNATVYYTIGDIDSRITLRPIAILPDRLLCIVEVQYTYAVAYGYQPIYRYETWIGSVPRSHLDTEHVTLEHFIANRLTSQIGYSCSACESGIKNCVWVNPTGFSGEYAADGTISSDLLLYDYVKREVVETGTTLSLEPYAPSSYGFDRYFHVGWSKAMRRLIVSTKQNLYVVKHVPIPQTVSAPEVVGDVGPMKIVSITPTNPAILKTQDSLSVWMHIDRLESGDKVYLSPDDLFSGYDLLYYTSPDSKAFAFTDKALTGRTWACTVIDDRTLSVPMDGAQAVSYYPCDLEECGTGGEVYRPYNAVAEVSMYVDPHIRAGTQVVFSNFTPPEHPLNGMTAEIQYVFRPNFYNLEYIYDIYRYESIPYFSLDLSGWGAFTYEWPDGLEGVYRPRTDIGPIPVHDCYMTRAYEIAAVTALDLSGPTPVYTVDNPAWLDALGVAGNTDIRIEGIGTGLPQMVGYLGATYTATATRVAADKFTYPGLPSDSLYRNLYVASMTIAAQAVVTLSAPSGYLAVGDTATFPYLPDTPALENVVATVLQVVAEGLVYMLDLDTTARTVTTGGFLRILTASEFRGRVEATALAFVNNYNTDAKLVRTRVVGARDEPCSGRAIAWTATGGTFKYSVTETDEDGYAYAIYYPPANAPGAYDISVAVNTP